MNISFNKSHLNWKQLICDKKMLTVLSITINIPYQIIMNFNRRLKFKLCKRIKNEGYLQVCKLLKDTAKYYKINRKLPNWFKIPMKKTMLKYPLALTMVLDIHRQMRAVKPDFNISAIVRKSNKSKIKKFFLKHELSISLIKRLNIFKFPKEIMGDYEVKDKVGIHTEFKRLGNLSNDPTVDSNDRTGGLRHPIRITLSSCANGPAICSQNIDAYFLLKTEYKTIKNAISWLWWMYEYKLDLDYYINNYDNLKNQFDGKSIYKGLAKLFPILDKSCKTRVIAIPDTFTQIALRPIHNLLDLVMKKINNDFFDNHHAGVKYLMSHKGYYFSSIDLISATDNIPVEIGLYVLDIVLSQWNSITFRTWHRQRTVSNVKKLLIGHKFFVPGLSEPVQYNTGQGMGLYASFPLLGLSQHFLVAVACIESGFNYSDLVYAVVGDDLVIGNYAVAKEYIKICKELNIPINMSKGLEGTDSFEFCSRIVIKGEMRSCPSLKSFYEASRTKDPYPLLKLFIEYEVPIPRYELLLKIFSSNSLRNMLAFKEVNIPNGPKVQKIPADIKTHAERVLEIEMRMHRYDKKKLKIISDDPFVKRLSYCQTITSVFKSNIKKYKKYGKNLWYISHKIAANTFYLGYVDTYKDRNRLRKSKYSFNKNEVSKIQQLRELCMVNRNQWKLINSKYL